MPNIGVDFKFTYLDVDDHSVKIQIWDTAGHEKFRTITTSYYKQAQCFAIVYDITKTDSFEHVENWLNDIDKFGKQGVMRLLVGNKCDLEHWRQVGKEKGKELADKYKIEFVETSAKESVNIDKIFNDTTRNYISKQWNDDKNATRSPIVKKTGNGLISLSEPMSSKKNKKNCC